MKKRASTRIDTDWLTENFFNQISVKEFFTKYQGKKCVKKQVSFPHRAALPTWEDINYFLSNQRLTYPRVRMSLEGASADQLRIFSQKFSQRGEPIMDILQGRAYAALRAGGTLVLDAIDSSLPSVKEITASVTKNFFVNAQANAYITFGNKRGFGIHWDDHDVFVIQLYGRKTWNMYGFTRPAPMHKDYHGDHHVPKELTESIDVYPGDILYVPRGCWHDVIGNGEPTLHLTIGVTAPTGIDIIDWLKDYVRANEFFRRDVPLHQPYKEKAYSENFTKELSGIFSKKLLKSFFSELKSSVHAYPKFSLPYGINNTVSLEGHMEIRFVPDVLNIVYSNEQILIESNNQVWKLPVRIKKLIESLLVKRKLSIENSWTLLKKDLSESSYNDWLKFLDGLIAQGLIYVVLVSKPNKTSSQ